MVLLFMLLFNRRVRRNRSLLLRLSALFVPNLKANSMLPRKFLRKVLFGKSLVRNRLVIPSSVPLMVVVKPRRVAQAFLNLKSSQRVLLNGRDPRRM